MFSYQQYYPSAPLADFIECYWLLDAPGRFMDTPDRLIPGGRVELIFNFGAPLDWLISADNPKGTRMNGPILMGQRDRIFYAKSSGKTRMLGVRFKPGGLLAFTPMPASGLLNALMPAELVLGAQLKSWEMLLQEQSTDEKMVRALDVLLKKALKSTPDDRLLVNFTIDALRNSQEDISIATICQQTGWYYKKLERVFLKNTGYTPKYYHKLLRFNKAVRIMRTTDVLTDICYECNYFDQAHFIRDFRQFTGTTPGQFKKEDNKIAAILIKHQPV